MNIRALVVLGVAAVVASTGLVQPTAFGHRSGGRESVTPPRRQFPFHPARVLYGSGLLPGRALSGLWPTHHV